MTTTEARGARAGSGQGGDVAVEVSDLVKRYPRRPSNAVDGISFSVRRGEIFGLLGPNGAGKTTTIGVLTTRVRATSGTASVAGVDVAGDPAGARAVLAVVPQRPNLDRSLTAVQNLTFSAGYHGVPRRERRARAATLLERFGLGDRGADKVDRYSGGQAQRLMIARALMHDPRVFFLDEPSTGLDPQARLFVWERVRELRERGVTVVLTTHDMDEAESITDRVAIVDHGKILTLDTPSRLVASLSGGSSIDLAYVPAAEPVPTSGSAGGDGADAVQPTVRALRGVTGVEALGAGTPGGAVQRLRVSVGSGSGTDAQGLLGPLAGAVAAAGATVTELRVGRASLEDVFISLTGSELR